MRQSALLALPLRRPEEVIPHLSERYHWKQGYSAKALADSWSGRTDLPPSVRCVLDQESTFQKAELLEGWLERETDLGDGERGASQTDLLALLGLPGELAVLSIEAKVNEPLGPTVFARSKNGSDGARRRIDHLRGFLNIAESALEELRYQLLHRAAATVLEAKRFRASKAVLVIQSFSADATGFDDYQRFVRAIGAGDAGQGRLNGPVEIDGVSLWLGWAACDIPASGLTIAELRQTTTASRSQWKGWLTDGRPIYIRYRWGELTVRIGKLGVASESIFEGPAWFDGAVGRQTDCMIDLRQVLQATGLALAPDIAALAQ